MGARVAGQVRYSVLDPTGNITALVESAVPLEGQVGVAAEIMRLRPEVEQVGFVSEPAVETGVQTELRMAGGEFCGNATMSAAALWCMRSGDETAARVVRLRVSGAAEPVEVRLTRTDDQRFDGRVHMPCALGIGRIELAWEDLRGTAGLVRMEGISHLVIERDSTLFALLSQPAVAERAVRAWCGELVCDGLGLMFVEGEGDCRTLTPLVYVPGGDTVFWENSCASGSSAVGMWCAAAQGTPCQLELHEPGGILRVESDPAGSTWLQGTVELRGTFCL